MGQQPYVATSESSLQGGDPWSFLLSLTWKELQWVVDIIHCFRMNSEQFSKEVCEGNRRRPTKLEYWERLHLSLFEEFKSKLQKILGVPCVPEAGRLQFVRGDQTLVVPFGKSFVFKWSPYQDGPVSNTLPEKDHNVCVYRILKSKKLLQQTGIEVIILS